MSPAQIKLNKRTLTAALTLALSAALLTACGDAPATNPTTTSQASSAPQPGTVPVGANGTQFTSDVGGLPIETLNLISGTYQGKLQRLDWDAKPIASQDYTLTITHDEVTVNNQKYRRALARFTSNGAVGNIDFTSNLYVSIHNWGGTYTFMTDAKNSAISSELSALELILTFQNGNTFDPAQSKIYIKGCGFSQGLVCSNVVEDAVFENDALIKR